MSALLPMLHLLRQHELASVLSLCNPVDIDLVEPVCVNFGCVAETDG